jgi:hypothetical protein
MSCVAAGWATRRTGWATPQTAAVPDRAASQPTTEVRACERRFLAARPTLDGESQPALRLGDLALTSTTFSGGATAEVARRQPDGTWLWVIDQPSILS